MKKKLFLCIACILLLSGCEEYVTHAPADTELRIFLARSAVTQDKEGNIIGMDLAANIDYKPWVATLHVTKEIEEDIRNNWDYRMVFCDVPFETLVVQNGIYYLPATAEVHYVYLNKELKVVQYNDTAYSLYEPSLEDSITVLESIIYREGK